MNFISKMTDRVFSTGRVKVSSHFVLSLLFCLTLFGCSTNYSDIKFVDANFKSFKMVGLAAANVDMEAIIDNPTGTSFKVSDIHGVLYINGVKFATFHSYDTIEIERRREKGYDLSVTAILADAMGAIQLLGNTDKIDINNFTIDISANVKKGAISIPVTKEKIPLSRLVGKNFSLSN